MGDNEFLSGFLAGQGDGGGNRGGGMFGGDGSWIFAIIILAMVFGGGRLFGGGDNGGGGGGYGYGAPVVVSAPSCGCSQAVSEGFALNNITSGIRGIERGICDSTYALNNSLMTGFHGVDNALCTLGYQTQQGFHGVERGFCDLSHQIAQCCCDNRAAIADLKYTIATEDCATRNLMQNNTRDIIENQNNSTRAILDFLTQDKISTLTAENQALKFQASQTAQNAYLTATMDANVATILRRTGHDCPTAAYIVQPPTPVNFPTNGCGTVQFGNYGGNGCGCGC